MKVIFFQCSFQCDYGNETFFFISRRLVKQPRMTGTVGDLKMATTLRDFFKEQSFDSAKLVPYNVLLAFPDQKFPNHVELYDRRDNLVFTSQYGNGATNQNSNESEALPPFSAYSAVGSPKVGNTSLEHELSRFICSV